MYFPYLRGKQNELIALRNMCEFTNANGLISPIIEPVKLNTATLKKTLDILVKNSRNFTLIINPSVGEIDNPRNVLLPIIEELRENYDDFQTGILINRDTNINTVLSYLFDFDLENLCIICEDVNSRLDLFSNLVNDGCIKNIVLNSNISNVEFSSIINSSGKDLIKLNDPFVPQRTNALYRGRTNEYFSDEHFRFEENGFVGFSDYLTIGFPYSASGWTPVAVTIHLTYIDISDDLRVSHFVSDSRLDSSDDLSQKIESALEKLENFTNDNQINSYAVQEFRALIQEGRSTSLGFLKRLSMCHHLEIISNFLN